MSIEPHSEHEDQYDLPDANQFATPRHERLVGPIVRRCRMAWYRLTRPVVLIADRVAGACSACAWYVDRALARTFQCAHWAYLTLVENLGMEGLHRKRMERLRARDEASFRNRDQDEFQGVRIPWSLRLRQGLTRMARPLRWLFMALIDVLRFEGFRHRVRDLRPLKPEATSSRTDAHEFQGVTRNWQDQWSHRIDRVQARVQLNWLWITEILHRWAENSLLVRWLLAPVHLLLFISYAGVDFLLGWIWTRNYRHLLFGLPAVLMVMPLAYCAARLPFYTNDEKAEHYRQAISLATENDNPDEADLYYRKLAQLGNINERVVYLGAIGKADAGDLEAAMEQMQTIAKHDEIGFLAAHYWIAAVLHERLIELPAADRDEQIEGHLRQILAQDSRHIPANLLMAEHFQATNRPEETRALLRKLRVDQLPPESLVRVATLYRALGDRSSAQNAASQVVQHYASLTEEQTSELPLQEQLAWGAGLELSGRLDEALAKLIEIHQLSDDESLSQLILKQGIGMYDSLPAVTSADWNRRWELLNQWLTVAPENATLLERLADSTDQPFVSHQASQRLTELESQVALPASVYRRLADRAIARNDLGTARDYYIATIKADQNQPIAINNLAWIVARYPPIDQTRALELVDRALEMEADNPHFYETRGQILIMLERWHEAIDALERALNGMPSKKEIHASLATAYEQIGRPETAAAHRNAQ